MPFVVFEVERILGQTEVSSAEGRDRAMAELAPVLATIPPSVLRDELPRPAAERYELLRRLKGGTPPRSVPGR